LAGSTAIVSNNDALNGANGYPGAVVNLARDFLITFFADEELRRLQFWGCADIIENMASNF
jgi:hypothetical protein